MISIHALRGEGDFRTSVSFDGVAISIHALRGEGDPIIERATKYYTKFQSTPSVGRATPRAFQPCQFLRFQSTPSVGRATCEVITWQRKCRNFNPRPPWGGRRDYRCRDSTDKPNFNPRPPWGGRLFWIKISECREGISIHALRGEGDLQRLKIIPKTCHFNPRPPWGGRQVMLLLAYPVSTISIHALRGEGDNIIIWDKQKNGIFQSTPSVGRATRRRISARLTRSRFQSTPSVGRATYKGQELL